MRTLRVGRMFQVNPPPKRKMKTLTSEELADQVRMFMEITKRRFDRKQRIVEILMPPKLADLLGADNVDGISARGDRSVPGGCVYIVFED